LKPRRSRSPAAWGQELRGTSIFRGGECGNNLGTIAPKHQRRRGSRADQKAGRINTIDVPALSAKPPSPVQIRAAPPKFLNEIAGFRRSYLSHVLLRVLIFGPKWPRVLRAAIRNVLCTDVLRDRGCERVEVRRTSRSFRSANTQWRWRLSATTRRVGTTRVAIRGRR
jgi:hypothetical protein